MAEKSSSETVLARLASLEGSVQQILSILQSGRGSSGAGEQAASISQADWDALGDKLDRFETTLTPKEKAVLMTVLGAAAATFDRAGLTESPAVGGASRIKVSGALDRVRLSDGLKSIGTFQAGGAGGFSNPIDPLADSIGVGGDFTCVHGDWSKDLKGMTGIDDAMVRGRWNALGGGLATNPIASGGFGRSAGGGGFG